MTSVTILGGYNILDDACDQLEHDEMPKYQ